MRPTDRKDMELMVRAYLACAEWSSTDEEGDPIDALGFDFATETIAKAHQQCTEFAQNNSTDLEGMDPEQAGHDFWLTRNHHGAGFWDRGLGAAGRRLTDAAHVYGGAYVFDADGLLFIENA